MEKIIELPIKFSKNLYSNDSFEVFYFGRIPKVLSSTYYFKMSVNNIDYHFEIQSRSCDTFIIQENKVVPAIETYNSYEDDDEDEDDNYSFFEVIDQKKLNKIGIPFNNVFYSRIEAEEFAKYLCKKYPINE